MVISPNEAGAALRDVEITQARTLEANAYRIGSLHLFLWGAVWIAGYGAMGLLPAGDWGPLWLVLDIVGVGGSLLLRMINWTTAGPGSLRWFGAFGAVVLFVAATYVVMEPLSVAQYQVYPTLAVALVYTLVGTWRLPRYVWIGAGIFVLAMIGYLFLKPWLTFWLALVGGGGLILGGVWLRRA